MHHFTHLACCDNFYAEISRGQDPAHRAGPQANFSQHEGKTIPEPPPVTEQPSKPVSEPAPAAPVKVPPPRVETAPEPVPEPDSVSIEKEDIVLQAPASSEASPTPTPAAAQTLEATPKVNPFNGLLERINLLKNSTYPLIAKKKGWQGSIMIQVELDEDGRLISAEIISECRYSSLNEAALKLVKKALEQPYLHNTGKTAILRLPITYKLH